MQQGTDNALRTRVYIDGYNLYYGCLKHSTDKWLDVRTLIERILPSIFFEQDGEPVRFAFQAPAVNTSLLQSLRHSPSLTTQFPASPTITRLSAPTSAAQSKSSRDTTTRNRRALTSGKKERQHANAK